MVKIVDMREALQQVREKAPNTADAMKRYKSGNAGFTDKSHLKAKGLMEKHTPAFELEEWTWHYGAGAEAIIYNEENALTGSQSSFFFGIAGVAGLDYNFADYPIALSLNWIPVINILGATGNIRMFDASLSARYIIN